MIEKPAGATDEECWIWTRAHTFYGYGAIWYQGKLHNTHRVAFFEKWGYWPKTCRHTCDTPACYNWRHLIDGTMKANSQDMMKRGRGRGQYQIKLDAEAVEEIVTRYLAGERPADIARDFGIHYATVRNYAKKRYPELVRSRRGGKGQHLYAR